MGTDITIHRENRSHNYLASAGTLPEWANRYLSEEVVGIQSPATLDAKVRDLQDFMNWYSETIGHLGIEDWMRRDTVSYLEHLQSKGRAPATVNRALAVIRHFARWLLDRPDCPLKLGSPVRGIRGLAIEERPAQALSSPHLNAIFRSAEKAILTVSRANGRPKRNRAILAVLYFTGLRVSEVCNLRLNQYVEGRLINIRRKGRSRSRSIHLAAECRRILDEYLTDERPLDDGRGPWLFRGSSSTAPLTRRTMGRILKRIAEDASAHRKDTIKVHPHKLRHTFGTKVRKLTGSDHETAAHLGHSSTRHVGIYSRNTEDERAEVLEQLSSI